MSNKALPKQEEEKLMTIKAEELSDAGAVAPECPHKNKKSRCMIKLLVASLLFYVLLRVAGPCSRYSDGTTQEMNPMMRGYGHGHEHEHGHGHHGNFHHYHHDNGYGDYTYHGPEDNGWSDGHSYHHHHHDEWMPSGDHSHGHKPWHAHGHGHHREHGRGHHHGRHHWQPPSESSSSDSSSSSSSSSSSDSSDLDPYQYLVEMQFADEWEDEVDIEDREWHTTAEDRGFNIVPKEYPPVVEMYMHKDKTLEDSEDFTVGEPPVVEMYSAETEMTMMMPSLIESEEEEKFSEGEEKEEGDE